jgi:hypothetical protein
LLCYLWDRTIPQRPSTKYLTAENVVRTLKIIKRIGRLSESEKITELVRKARLKGVLDAYETIKDINDNKK